MLADTSSPESEEPPGICGGSDGNNNTRRVESFVSRFGSGVAIQLQAENPDDTWWHALPDPRADEDDRRSAVHCRAGAASEVDGLGCCFHSPGRVLDFAGEGGALSLCVCFLFCFLEEKALAFVELGARW